MTLQDQLDALIARCEEEGRDDIAVLICCAALALECKETSDALLDAVSPIVIGLLLTETARRN